MFSIITRAITPRLARQVYPSLQRFSTINPEEHTEHKENTEHKEYKEYSIPEDTRQFKDHSPQDFENLYKDDNSGKIKEFIEKLLEEYEFMKYDTNGRVPSILTEDEMRVMIEDCPNQDRRAKYLSYLFKRECDRRKRDLTKVVEKEETARRLELKNQLMTEKLGKHGKSGLLSENGNLIYGLWHNSLFMRINDHAESVKFTLNSLIRVACMGRPLIFDFGYDEYMDRQRLRSCFDQVRNAHAINRYEFDEPFDIWFCNANPDTMEKFESKFLPNLREKALITVKEKCPTEYFDKDRLVYLSPHAEKYLGEFRLTDDIPIIGAFNDKGKSQCISYRRAQSMGIKCRALPIDKYVNWGTSSKSLCINHVVAILLELIHNNGDWKHALETHIPRRKLKPPEVVELEEHYRQEKFEKIKAKNRYSHRRGFDGFTNYPN